MEPFTKMRKMYNPIKIINVCIDENELSQLIQSKIDMSNLHFGDVVTITMPSCDRPSRDIRCIFDGTKLYVMKCVGHFGDEDRFEPPQCICVNDFQTILQYNIKFKDVFSHSSTCWLRPTKIEPKCIRKEELFETYMTSDNHLVYVNTQRTKNFIQLYMEENSTKPLRCTSFSLCVFYPNPSSHWLDMKIEEDKEIYPTSKQLYF